ncbi:MAG: HYR domain-containing protein, partial [Bacteroidales bacterium]|nr:HYR domain-containing protein [Bacteroidales bacterium]
DKTLSADAGCEAVVPDLTGEIVATDNDAVASISQTPAAGTSIGLGNTTVVFTVADNAGNTSTCTANVTVIDDVGPVITNCASDITVASDDEYCGNTVAWTPPGATDNCEVTVTSTHAPDDFFEVGTTTVTYTATDASGNTSTCSFDVTVSPADPPEINGESTVCTPATTTYTTSSLPGKTYEWDVTGGTIPGANGASEVNVDWTGTGTGTVSLVVTSASGCSISNSTSIVKNATPNTGNIETITNQGQGPVGGVCAGDTGVTYIVSGWDDSNFEWALDGGMIKQNNGNSILVDWGDIPGEYEISVQEVSVQGCPGEIKQATVLVSVPEINLGDDAFICEGEVFTVAPDGVFASYLWQDGSTLSSFSTNVDGLISCLVTDQNGCTNADEIYLEVYDVPVVEIGNDTSLCGNEFIILDAGTDGEIYRWSTGENSREITVYQGYQEIWVEVENEYTCVNSDTLIIEDCDINDYFSDIPTAITPSNGDGINDNWRIQKLEGFPDAVVDIYDRWGRLIWRSEPGYPDPWDGRDLRGKSVPMDSYHYVILLNFMNLDRVVGSVTVIR